MRKVMRVHGNCKADWYCSPSGSQFQKLDYSLTWPFLISDLSASVTSSCGDTINIGLRMTFWLAF